jgi:hypothetical protein
MRRLILTAATIGLALLAASDPRDVQAQGWWDVEHARMNALAGGPTNAWDAWILERYGCYSGTPSGYCHGPAYGVHYYRAHRRQGYRR